MKNYLLKFNNGGSAHWMTVCAANADAAVALAEQIEVEVRIDVSDMRNASWLEYAYVCIELDGASQ